MNFRLILSLLFITCGCSSIIKEPDSALPLKIPIAIIASNNHFVKFIIEDSNSFYKEEFDSSCLYNIVSLNDGLKVKLKNAEDCYLKFTGKCFVGSNDFKNATLFTLKDMGNSFVVFKNNNKYLRVDAHRLSNDTEISSNSLFFIMYDPLQRVSDYQFGESIFQFQSEIKSNKTSLGMIKNKAKIRKQEIYDVVFNDAHWLYKNKRCFDFLSERYLFHYQKLKSNKKLIEDMKNKSMKTGMSEDSLFRLSTWLKIQKELK